MQDPTERQTMTLSVSLGKYTHQDEERENQTRKDLRSKRQSYA